jgi:MFS family permease
MGIGFGGSQPVIQAASIRHTTPEKRGAASATFMMGQSMGFIIGPMIGGYLAVSSGYGRMFEYMTVVAFCSILVLLFTGHRQKNVKL